MREFNSPHRTFVTIGHFCLIVHPMVSLSSWEEKRCLMASLIFFSDVNLGNIDVKAVYCVLISHESNLTEKWVNLQTMKTSMDSIAHCGLPALIANNQQITCNMRDLN